MLHLYQSLWVQMKVNDNCLTSASECVYDLVECTGTSMFGIVLQCWSSQENDVLVVILVGGFVEAVQKVCLDLETGEVGFVEGVFELLGLLMSG